MAYAGSSLPKKPRHSMGLEKRDYFLKNQNSIDSTREMTRQVVRGK
jgi:hypothetical protein